MRKHGRVPSENITNKEEKRSSSESDLKPDLKKTKSFYFYKIIKELRPNQ